MIIGIKIHLNPKIFDKAPNYYFISKLGKEKSSCRSDSHQINTFCFVSIRH